MTAPRVLLIGSGGREHALAWRLTHLELNGYTAENERPAVFCAPGNFGTHLTPGCQNVTDLHLTDAAAVIQFVKQKQIDLVVIGPEKPLADGLADALRAADLAVVGPGAEGAQLESSKAWAKAFMAEYGIPTAAYRRFHRTENTWAEVAQYLSQHPLPVVVKASGLAGGKGVAVCATHAEALAFAEPLFTQGAMNHAGEELVIEHFLQGRELSVFILTDGTGRYVLLPEAKDYKRRYEHDAGPNTGGMGAVSPVPWATPAVMEKVKEHVIIPTLHGLRHRGIDYRGFLYFGLMISPAGEPGVIEYNCRLGDPETQAIMPRISGRWYDVLAQAAAGKLKEVHLINQQPSVCMVCVGQSYPDTPSAQAFAVHLDAFSGHADGMSILFVSGIPHAGGSDAIPQSTGGRVISCVSATSALEESVRRTKECAEKICADNEALSFRKDIGLDVLEYIQQNHSFNT